MSQDFNLLGTAPRSSQRGPVGRQFSWAAGALIAIGLATTFWLNFRADRAEKQIEAGNAAIEELVLNLQERSQFLAQRNVNPDLVGRLQELERESTDKGRVFDALAGKTLGNTAGFSSQLAALGRRHPPGLWLQQVRIGDGGREVTLRGRAQGASLVPQFIGALQAEAAFAGVAFEQFEMKEPKDGAGTHSFALVSGCDDAATPEIEACTEAEPPPTPTPTALPVPFPPENAS